MRYSYDAIQCPAIKEKYCDNGSMIYSDGQLNMLKEAHKMFSDEVTFYEFEQNLPEGI